MNRFLLSRAPGLALALLLGGCAAFTPTDRATLGLVDVRAASSTIFESTLEVTLRVTNQANQPLRIEGTTHDLTLNGDIVGHGASQGVTEVPALGTATIPVAIRMDNLKLLNQFGRGNLPEEISYHLKSRLYTKEAVDGLLVLTDGSIDLRPFRYDLKLN